MTTTPSTGSKPGRTAYLALLACSTLGTLASTIMSAPINVIAHAIGASPRGIVFAVSAFTLGMVVFSPISGWLCQRFGSRPVLAGSLVLMVLAQAGAATTQDLTFLVVMRALQGIACAAVPPAVQQVLGLHWAHQRARVMAAWAAAIGLGQALGPPLGGLIAETLGWRWVFLTHATLSAVLVALCLTVVPSVPAAPARLHVSGLTTLIVGVGGLVGALTWLGQHGDPWIALGIAGTAVVALVVHGLLGRTPAGAFVAPAVLRDRQFIRSTAAAATVMGCLGVAIVATPLHLGRDAGLGPGPIGVVMLALALAMTVAAPLSTRITARSTSLATLRGALLLLAGGLLALPAVAVTGGLVVALTVVALVVTGSALGSAQAATGHLLITSAAAADAVALGVHNMLRFTGLAIGYTWVAIAYPTGSLWLVYGVPVLGVAATFVIAGPGGRARTAPDPTSRTERVTHA